jgi:hypothetical protein
MVDRSEGNQSIAVTLDLATDFKPGVRRDTRAAWSAENELKLRVINSLWKQSVPALRWLVVEAEGQSITLHGMVRTFYEKQLAVSCCQRVAGVSSVVDAIAVQTAK